jgi:WD40 repeat protein
VASGQELMSFSGHSGPVTDALFCPDGERIVTASKDKTAKVWSVRAANQEVQLRVPDYALHSGIFSPDGKLILTRDATAPEGWRGARLWDSQTAQPLHRFQLPGVSVRSADFTPDGGTVIIKGWARGPGDGSGPNQKVGLWETLSGRAITNVSEMTNLCDVADVSRDARWLFMARKSDAGIWDIKSEQRVCTLESFKYDLGRAMFSPRGSRLMTTFGYGDDYGSATTLEHERTRLKMWKDFPYAKFWDTSNGTEVCAVKFYQSSLTSPVFTPDGRHLLTFGFNTCHFWDPETCSQVRQFKAHSGIVSQDSKSFFGTTFDGNICVIDLESGREQVLTKAHREDGRVTSLSSDGKRFLTSGLDGTAKLWDAATGRELLSFKTAIGKHSFPTFSPDDRRIIITVDGTVMLLGTSEWK